MPDLDRFHHHRYLAEVAMEDVRYVTEKDVSYGASWKMSGGRSAWFMLKRKIDRMVEFMRRPDGPAGFEEALAAGSPVGSGLSISEEAYQFLVSCMTAEDIFAKITEAPGGADGTVLAEVRDLRRYLLLVEAEMVARGHVERPSKPERVLPRRVTRVEVRRTAEPPVSEAAAHAQEVVPTDYGDV